MKKHLWGIFSALLICGPVAAQSNSTADSIRKSVTSRTSIEGKSLLEKMFWGFTNSPVEYFAAGIKAQGSLRIHRSWPDRRWTLEVIPFENHYTDVYEWNRYVAEARNYRRKYVTPFPLISIMISESFAEIFREKMRTMIDGYNARSSYGDDGAVFGFRCVVGDEVWSLSVWMPDDRDVAGRMSGLCQHIIEDMTGDGHLDEEKYISALEQIEF